MNAVMNILKDSTKHLHGQLEEVSFAREIMSKQLSPEQYQELLVKNYLIYKYLEPQLNKGLKEVGRLFPQRFSSQRLRDIESDLSYFSSKKPKVGEKEFNIDFKSPAAWLGVLYVLEGARLGGNVIVKALKNNPQLKDVPEFHFYEQKEVNIRERWMGFQKAISSYVITEENIEVTTSAAIKTFQCFYEVHRSSVV